jgi:hypothetical protein
VSRGFERFPFAEKRRKRWSMLRRWVGVAQREIHELGSELRPSQILALLMALRSRSLWFRAFTIASWFYRARKVRRRAKRPGRRG